jgi:hypothetical protein
MLGCYTSRVTYYPIAGGDDVPLGDGSVTIYLPYRHRKSPSESLRKPPGNDVWVTK